MGKILEMISNSDFIKIIFSGLLLPIIVSYITFKISINNNDRKLKKKSKDIIIEEIRRINNIAEDFHKESNGSIKNLKEKKFDKVPCIILTGMYTIYSDNEWINFVNDIKDELKSEQYIVLIRFHKIFTSIDSVYPIKSFRDSVDENSEKLIRWWKSTESIYDNKEINQMKKIVQEIK